MTTNMLSMGMVCELFCKAVTSRLHLMTLTTHWGLPAVSPQAFRWHSTGSPRPSTALPQGFHTLSQALTGDDVCVGLVVFFIDDALMSTAEEMVERCVERVKCWCRLQIWYTCMWFCTKAMEKDNVAPSIRFSLLHVYYFSLTYSI